MHQQQTGERTPTHREQLPRLAPCGGGWRRAGGDVQQLTGRRPELHPGGPWAWLRCYPPACKRSPSWAARALNGGCGPPAPAVYSASLGFPGGGGVANEGRKRTRHLCLAGSIAAAPPQMGRAATCPGHLASTCSSLAALLVLATQGSRCSIVRRLHAGLVAPTVLSSSSHGVRRCGERWVPLATARRHSAGAWAGGMQPAAAPPLHAAPPALQPRSSAAARCMHEGCWWGARAPDHAPPPPPPGNGRLHSPSLSDPAPLQL